MSDKERRTRKYMQDQRQKKRLERAAKDWRGYPACAYWEEERYLGDGKYEKLKKPYAKKMYKSAGCKRYRYYKKLSNRQVRKSDCAIPNGNWYRKIFDYAWEVD